MPASDEPPRFPWLSLQLDPSRADELGAILFELGALGVELQDDHTMSRGPGGGAVRLVASFAARAEAERGASWLADHEPDLSVEVGELIGDSWRDKYREYFKTFALTDSIVVRPPWEPATGDRAVAKRELVMDPGRAFGTGLHATTALCAEQLDNHADTFCGKPVLDVGTGSGILALVALLCGAERVRGIDVDPHAVSAAVENAALNQQQERFVVDNAPLDDVPGVFAMIANIRAGVLTEMVALLAERVAGDGLLVLSGILASEQEGVIQAYENAGMTCVGSTRRGQGGDAWCALVFRPGQ